VCEREIDREIERGGEGERERERAREREREREGLKTAEKIVLSFKIAYYVCKRLFFLLI
jgi:hypothetical protein